MTKAVPMTTMITPIISIINDDKDDENIENDNVGFIVLYIVMNYTIITKQLG